MKAFGNRLKKLRQQKKLTQSQLAEAVGLDQSTISYYERGKKAPEIQTLDKIATFFNVSIDDLWSNAVYPDPFVQGKIDGNDVPLITPKELKERYKLKVDGRPASEKEIDEAIQYILFQRKLKEGKDD